MRLVLVLLTAATAFAQSDDAAALRREIEELRKTQLAIQKDVRDIKAILESLTKPAAPAGPAAGVEISIDGAPKFGPELAKITIVEFTDYQCPYCKRYFTETYPKIFDEYVKTGRARYAVMHFPLESIHPDSFQAHEAAACAADQGKFWEMHARLFADPKSAGAAAAALGLDMARFGEGLKSGKHAEEVRRAQRTGLEIDVRGTPTFLIAEPIAGGRVKAIRAFSGALPYAQFKEAIDAALASAR